MVTEFQDIICLSIDAESEAGAVIAKKYAVRGYPTLLFLNSDGTPRDSIVGYMPTDAFHAELKRIKSGEGTTEALFAAVSAKPADLVARLDLAAKLMEFNDTAGVKEQVEAVKGYIERGEGYDPARVDSRWALCKGLRAVKEQELADAQLAAIKQLDPQGTSFPMRRMALDDALGELQRNADHETLREFLKSETHAELLYDGWSNMMNFSAWMANRTEDEESETYAKLAREASQHVWTHAPEADRAPIGNQIAWSFYEAEDDLTDEEKAFALEVAKQAAELAGDDVNVIDTYACCLFMNGDKTGAITQTRRCLELDPGNEEWIGRLEEFLED